MPRMTSLAKLRVPVGGQAIELQQIDFDTDDAGTPPADAPADPAPRSVVPMRLLRTRIREGSRFTVFDIDPITAEAWGEALTRWAREQPRE